jgi:hypothetical protein
MCVEVPGEASVRDAAGTPHAPDAPGAEGPGTAGLAEPGYGPRGTEKMPCGRSQTGAPWCRLNKSRNSEIEPSGCGENNYEDGFLA